MTDVESDKKNGDTPPAQPRKKEESEKKSLDLVGMANLVATSLNSEEPMLPLVRAVTEKQLPIPAYRQLAQVLPLFEGLHDHSQRFDLVTKLTKQQAIGTDVRQALLLAIAQDQRTQLDIVKKTVKPLADRINQIEQQYGKKKPEKAQSEIEKLIKEARPIFLNAGVVRAEQLIAQSDAGESITAEIARLREELHAYGKTMYEAIRNEMGTNALEIAVTSSESVSVGNATHARLCDDEFSKISQAFGIMFGEEQGDYLNAAYSLTKTLYAEYKGTSEPLILGRFNIGTQHALVRKAHLYLEHNPDLPTETRESMLYQIATLERLLLERGSRKVKESISSSSDLPSRMADEEEEVRDALAAHAEFAKSELLSPERMFLELQADIRQNEKDLLWCMEQIEARGPFESALIDRALTLDSLLSHLRSAEEKMWDNLGGEDFPVLMEFVPEDEDLIRWSPTKFIGDLELMLHRLEKGKLSSQEMYGKKPQELKEILNALLKKKQAKRENFYELDYHVQLRDALSNDLLTLEEYTQYVRYARGLADHLEINAKNKSSFAQDIFDRTSKLDLKKLPPAKKKKAEIDRRAATQAQAQAEALIDEAASLDVDRSLKKHFRTH
jgi:hypothetical protein